MCLLTAIVFLNKAEAAAVGGLRDKRSMIVNGHMAEDGQFPFAVALQRIFSNGCYGFCTMTLITTKTALGAAHCISDTEEKEPQKFCGLVGTVDVHVCDCCQDLLKIHRHSQFDRETLANDIATFIFEEEVQLSDYVKPIPLFGYQDKIDTDYVTVIGWGETKEHRVSVLLSYISLEVWPNFMCHISNDNRLCLESEKGGACKGDSGGPNIVTRSGQHILIGVSSYITSEDCGKGETVSTDVRGYTQWIIDHSDTSPKFISMSNSTRG